MDVIVPGRRFPAAPGRGDDPRHPFYDGTARSVAMIALVNGLLTIATLGVYRFWAKTRLRRYLWGRVNYEGDTFEYTGRPLELLIGFVIALVVLVALGATMGFAEFALAGNDAALTVLAVGQGLLILFLIHFAIFRARRYRLSRTQWRGIRGGQSGSAVTYGLMGTGWSLAMVVTAGLAYPFMRTGLQGYRLRHTWFGDRAFDFDARAMQLLLRWLVAWLLFIPTLGISYVWYRAQEFRTYAAHTRYGALRFDSDLGTTRLIWIGLRYGLTFIAILLIAGLVAASALPGMLSGAQMMASGQSEALDAAGTVMAGSAVTVLPILVFLAVIVALGVAQAALYVHPLLREICDTLAVYGTEDFHAIAQSQQAWPGRGEGFADALDVGAV